MPLRAAILMIYPVALVVPFKEAGVNEFSYNPAQVRFAGGPHMLLDLKVEQFFSLGRLFGAILRCCELIFELRVEFEAPWSAAAHRGERVAEPIADRHIFRADADERPEASILAGVLCNQAQQHEGIAWSARASSYFGKEMGQIRSGLDAFTEHSRIQVSTKRDSRESPFDWQS